MKTLFNIICFAPIDPIYDCLDGLRVGYWKINTGVIWRAWKESGYMVDRMGKLSSEEVRGAMPPGLLSCMDEVQRQCTAEKSPKEARTR